LQAEGVAVDSIGLEEIVERGDLGYLSPTGIVRRFRPTDFDSELLETADAAVAKRLPTAFVLPVPGTRTSVLLAAAMLVAHFARSRTLTAQVALVTRQLSLRAFYDTLYCRNERLVRYFPRTLVTPGGIISDVGDRLMESRDRPGRLHFVPDLDRVRAARIPLDGIVLESQATTEQSLRQFLSSFGRDVPLLYLTVDPQDPILPEFERMGAVWAWDGDAILSLLNGPNLDAVCANPDTLRSAADTTYIIAEPVGGSEVDDALARLWDDLVNLQDHPGGITFEAVGWAWGLFGALDQLVVPVAEYDRFARGAWGATALAEGSAKAQVFARNAPRTEDREYWEILAGDLEDAVEAAIRTNSKPEALSKWVALCASDEEVAIVVVRNRAAKQATESYLQARPEVPLGWDRWVEIVTFQDLLAGRASKPVGRALYAGAVTSRYGGLLALPPGRQLTVLVHGPWERGRAARQIRSVHDRLQALAHGPAHRAALRRLFGDEGTDEALDSRPLNLTHSEVAGPKAPATVRAALWNPFDLKATLSADAWEEDVEAPVETPSAEATGLTTAIRVGFEDGMGYFEPGQVVSRLVGGNLEKVAAKALSSGDRVILIEGGARRDLFDIVVAKLEQLPEFAAMGMLIHEWHERAARASQIGLTQYEILRRMGPDAGVSTTAAVGFWLRGFVEGPNDPEDIRRFGEAVGDEFLATRWRTLGQALATMRAHRRRLGRMLARVLEGLSPAQLEDDGYFDRRLGIHYSDLTEAVTLHNVVEVSKTPQLVIYQYVNRLLQEEDVRRIETQVEAG
jgi:hypothetical protein